MKIAAAQIACAPGDLKTNLRKVREFSTLARRSGAELIVFPEMVDTGYSMPTIKKHAAAWNQGAVPDLQQMAKELSLVVICGLSDRDGDFIHNAQVVIDTNGSVLAKYRKMHLVKAAPLDERSCFTPGDEFISCKHGQFTIGLSICYDLRFPEMCRALALRHGANLIATSSAWPMVRIEHLRIFALARAVENQSYVIVANRVGTDDGVTFCGSSVVIDPSGAILAAGSTDREELLQAEVSGEVVELARTRIPAFEHRRPELY
jgi:predicted amidohydrolase